jgi:hypothetical protein
LASIATPQRVDSLSGFADAPTSAVAPGMTDGSKAMPTPLDTAVIDQFFATVGKIDQQLWLAYFRSRTRYTVANTNLDAFSGDM